MISAAGVVMVIAGSSTATGGAYSDTALATYAGVVTAIIGLITLIIQNRSIAKKNAVSHIETAAKIQEVHVLVNRQLSEVLNRVSVLTSSLQYHEIPVPGPTATVESVRHPILVPADNQDETSTE